MPAVLDITGACNNTPLPSSIAAAAAAARQRLNVLNADLRIAFAAGKTTALGAALRLEDKVREGCRFRGNVRRDRAERSADSSNASQPFAALDDTAPQPSDLMPRFCCIRGLPAGSGGVLDKPLREGDAILMTTRRGAQPAAMPEPLGEIAA